MPPRRTGLLIGVVLAAIVVAFAVVVALTGALGSGAPAGTVAEDPAPSTEDPAPSTEDPAPSTEEPAPAAGDPRPEVGSGQPPPLHPEVDQLPAATVTIAPADPTRTAIDVAVRVAATPETRRRGLMEVPELPDDVGMLFLFDAPRTGGFWMWNTLVPLDIGFIAADGTLHEILAMDPCEATDPGDCPTYAPERPYVAAVEVRQGWFAANAITPGAQVAWPAHVDAEPSQ